MRFFFPYESYLSVRALNRIDKKKHHEKAFSGIEIFLYYGTEEEKEEGG